MRGLRSLPPSFLLPAWNRTHILQLAVNHHSKPSKVPKQQVAASSSARELNRDGLDQELRSKLGADERGILHRAEDERRSTGEAQVSALEGFPDNSLTSTSFGLDRMNCTDDLRPAL